MNTKPLLAFDCSGSGASITLVTKDSVTTQTLLQGQQATLLVPTIDAMMQEQALKYDALGEIITTVGPGSFTGLRIGLAALHGVVLVHHMPIKTLTSLEAMAWHVAQNQIKEGAFTIAFTVGKGELAVQEFTATNGAPLAQTDISRVPENYDAWVSPCFGNHLAPDAPCYLSGVNTETLCEISHYLPTSTLDAALPFYIRPPDAAIPKPHAWLAY